ncbi:hypothetical protein os1_35170 [Comamonadaceae bacterium OS-1]|nr:hypothetical protein os1_35170 [Comamonadaceae bacterium OS-1]
MRSVHTPLGIALATLLGITACSGGGDSPTPAAVTPVPSTLITGTAAAGAPIIGKVTVKDSLGAQKTVDIQANGAYSVDVVGLTGPFVFMADGTVGGRTIQIVSAATVDDISKTINITPFTDLIVANLAGQAAKAYFASPTFSMLTTPELNAARQTLTNRLLPILKAMGVSDSFDMLRSSFAADHSGFDAVMDVVRVSTDPATQIATITDLVNQTQIQDDLASKTDTSQLPTPAASLSDTVASLQGINQTLANFSAAFATGIPASNNAVLRALMAGDFVDEGGGVDEFLSAQAVLVPGMVGVQQSGASIVAVKDGGATMDVEFQSVTKTANGGHSTDIWHQQFRRNAQGLWQYAGNREWMYLEANSINARFPQQGGGWEYRANLGESVTTRNAQAAYALWSGPGIRNWVPSSLAGVTLSGTVLGRSGSAFKFYSVNGVPESTWLPDCAIPYAQHSFEVTCINLADVSAGAVYTVTLLDANGAPIGTPETVTLAGKPASTSEATAASDAWFPRLASTNPATIVGLVDGKQISFALTPPTNAAYTLWTAALQTPTRYTDTRVTGTTADLGVWSGSPPTSAQAVVTARDATQRRFVSFYDLP